MQNNSELIEQIKFNRLPNKKGLKKIPLTPHRHPCRDGSQSATGTGGRKLDAVGDCEVFKSVRPDGSNRRRIVVRAV